jgi:hypothetical protein
MGDALLEAGLDAFAGAFAFGLGEDGGLRGGHAGFLAVGEVLGAEDLDAGVEGAFLPPRG